LTASIFRRLAEFRCPEKSLLSPRNKAEALLVIITFVWGATFVIVKGALQDASPIPFLAVRFTLAGALLFLVLWRGPFDRKAIAPGITLGVFLFAGYLCQTWGLLYTTPSKSAFITGFSVVLVPALMMVGGQRMRPASVTGALVGLAGIYFLVVPSRLSSVNRGDVLTLFGACSFAIHIILVGRYTRRISFRHLVPLQILSVGILASVALPLDSTRTLHWTWGLVGAIIVTAVFATGFAFSVQNWAQQYTPPAHTALIFALEPVFAAISSWIVMGERLGHKALLGAFLVLCGMIVSELGGGAAPSPVES
jgi:drug/metabolite transporter (DMT)-like permease